MRGFCIAAVAASFLTIGAFAQTSTNSSASGNGSVTPGQAGTAQSKDNQSQTGAATTGAAAVNGGSQTLRLGTTLQAELSKSIDAKKAKPGDEVTARVLQDVKDNGKVVVHKGSKLVGHVTEAQAKNKENAESKLGVVFDKAISKGGEEVAFNGIIRGVSAPVDNLSSTLAAGNVDRDAGGRGITPTPIGGTNSSAAPVNSASRTGNAGNSRVNTVGGTADQVDAAGRGVGGGVNGIEGVTLAVSASGQSTVLTSPSRNVKLDTGTQMILQVASSVVAH